MIDLTGRVAGAPISWGVCEAPGWGFELPASRVLADMARLGLKATELGPTGYLGADAETLDANLAMHDLRLVGGFLPVVLHQPDLDSKGVAGAIAALAAGGSDVVVLSADAGPGGYDGKLELTDEQWRLLVGNLDRVRTIASDHGLHTSLHPHVGTAVESATAVHRLVETSDIPVCLDTGHLIIGGTDPVELARSIPERINHVHLKDVRLSVAEGVASGAVGFHDAVRGTTAAGARGDGLFAPLGDGDIDISAIIEALEQAGYDGWYVLEQDTSLHDPADVEQAVSDVERSLAHLDRITKH